MRARTLICSAGLLIAGCGSGPSSNIAAPLEAGSGASPSSDQVVNDLKCTATGSSGMSDTLASDTKGRATIAEAARSFLPGNLPKFPLPADLQDKAPAAGLHVGAADDHSARVDIIERSQLVGALTVTAINGGWVVSGYELCNDLLERSFR